MRQREKIIGRRDGRERRAAQHFDGVRRKIPPGQLHGLRQRNVDDAEDRLAIKLAQIGQHLPVLRLQKAQAAAPERLVPAARRASGAPSSGAKRISAVRFDIDPS